MTCRPGEFQRAPWSSAPRPSNILCRISAMRNARSGSLRRETIDDAGHDLLSLTRPQFRQSRIEGRLAPNLRMRRCEKTPRLLAILPNLFGDSDHTCETLGT